MDIKDRLKWARKKKGLSRLAVTKQLGIHRNSLLYWENGQSSPTAENIVKLCTYYDMSPNYLLNWKDATDENDFSLSDHDADLAFSALVDAGYLDFLMYDILKKIRESEENRLFFEMINKSPPELIRLLNSFTKTALGK